jgi:hypothetical protein
LKQVASFVWKTIAVTFFALGLSVLFSSSASADEVVAGGNVDDQADSSYLEYLLQLDSTASDETLTPEEQNAKDEADAAALAKALEGFDARLTLLNNEIFNHLEFDGGIKSWHKGVIYFSTTEAGYEFYSTKYKSMIDDGYLVLDATFDMVLLTEEPVMEEPSESDPARPILMVTVPGIEKSGIDYSSSGEAEPLLSPDPQVCIGQVTYDFYQEHSYNGGTLVITDGISEWNTTPEGCESYSAEFEGMIDAGFMVLDSDLAYDSLEEQCDSPCTDVLAATDYGAQVPLVADTFST